MALLSLLNLPTVEDFEAFDKPEVRMCSPAGMHQRRPYGISTLDRLDQALDVSCNQAVSISTASKAD